MSNILTDVIEDVQIKPAKMKLVLKWTISIAMSAIVIAFTFGQIKTARINKLNSLENLLDANTEAMIELRTEMKVGFDEVNVRINKIYDDGYKAFNNFQQFNNKQLGLIIDYSNTNKGMLKEMLELKSMEQTIQLENTIEKAKKETYVPTIIVKPIKDTVIKK